MFIGKRKKTQSIFFPVNTKDVLKKMSYVYWERDKNAINLFPSKIKTFVTTYKRHSKDILCLLGKLIFFSHFPFIISFFLFVQMKDQKDHDGGSSLSERYQLVLNIAKTVQNTLGQLSDSLEKLQK